MEKDSKKVKEPKKTKVFALIVAIDKYRGELLLQQGVTFPALGGCVNDANDMLAYLEADRSIQLEKLVLYDKAATKPAIIDGFRKHLAKATKNDVVFLYYSGHGAVEAADTSVWQDAFNECLVCYYDKPHSPDFLLADKELRFLLKELYDKTKAHIVTIFDCCHSGDNTREVFAGKENKVVRRQVDWTFDQRKWSEFLFADKYKSTDFAGKSINDVYPQAPHIQIAAAERDEPALEVNGRGVLTSHLTKSLRAANGNLSYLELHSRIRNQVKFLFIQKPKLYSPDGSLQLHEMGFLKKSVQRGEGLANLVYNKKWGWTVDRGVLHGVVEGKTIVEFQAQNEKWSQKVGKAELERAQVSGVVGLDKEKQYGVVLKGLAGKALRLQLVNKDASTAEFRALNAALESLVKQDMITYEDSASRADYSLVIWRGMYYVTKPGDFFRPLFRPVTAGKDGEYPSDSSAVSLAGLANSLQQMSEWAYLNDLDNKAGGLPDSSLKVEFFRVKEDGGEIPLAFNAQQTATLDYDEIIGNPNKKWGGKVRIKLTNATPKTKIYAAVLYQTADFGSNPNLMEPVVAELEPGKPKIVRDHKGGTLNMSLDANVVWYNLPSFTDTFKVVFSTEEFAANGLKRDGLPELLNPDNIDRGELEGKKGMRGAFGEEDEPLPTLQGWNAQTFRLEFRNPEFNKVPAAAVKRMLEADNDELAHFGMGLYFQSEGFNAKIVAPKGVEAVAEKGLAWDATLAIANKWARHWRNRHYKKMLERNPTTPVFISEGDSWFQHPMLKDIIDNVGELYPVYCLSAAGDTIENYLRDEEYKDAIEQQKPAGFLISGGGNDILGESLRNLLNKAFDEAPEGERPERFFNAQFQQAMANILKYYREIFAYCKQVRPGMKIYIHGYDYVLPLKPEESKNKGWLGKFLNEAGVIRDKDRTAAVLHMMGLFNKNLKALAAEHPGQVEYIELLGTVKPDQWSDEIHPTDEGYQEVSLKFIKRIRETIG